MSTGFSKTAWVAAGCALAATALWAATPQEEAFIKVWRIHAKDPTKHDAVIAACQSVMDKASTLGEFLPVVRTLAGWHLMASGRQQDAVPLFESALTADKAAPAIARNADTLARRWLTRIDCLAVEKALRAYYATHVEFPGSLSSVLTQPNPPPKADRFGDAWAYAPESFSKLKQTSAKYQRFSLYSRSLGKALTPLKQLPFTAYGKKQATITARRGGNPVIIEFETAAEGAAPQRGTASEGSAVNGIRFLKLSSDGQFALMIETENDFWVVATTGGR